jgi:hypothetical protein
VAVDLDMVVMVVPVIRLLLLRHKAITVEVTMVQHPILVGRVAAAQVK